MSDVEIGGQAYRIGRLDVRSQFHVARRLTPVLAGVAGVASDVLAALPPSDSVADLASSLKTGAGAMAGALKSALANAKPVADTLASMPDEEADYILKACLGVVQVSSRGVYAKVQAANGSMMFDFITLPVMLQLIWHVLQESLGDFFPALPSTSSAAGVTA